MRGSKDRFIINIEILSIMSHGVMVILAIFLVPLSLAYGETISAQDEDSNITIQLDGDRLITYSVSLAGGSEIIEPMDPKLKTRNFGFLIIDRTGGFFAAVKNTDDGYKIKVRISLDTDVIVKEYTVHEEMKQEKKQAANTDEKTQTGNEDKKPEDKKPEEKKPAVNPNLGQRDLLGSTKLESSKDEDMPPKSTTDTRAEAAQKKLDEDLKKLAEQNKNQLKSKKDDPTAVTSYDAYKKQTANATSEPTAPTNIESFRLFTHVPHIKLNSNLEHEVLVTDNAKIVQSGRYNTILGNSIPDVAITSVLKNSKGKVLNEQEGITDKSGVWAAKPYKIPDQKEKEKFIMDITATYKSGEKTIREKEQKIFRTVSEPNDVYDGKPKASITHTVTKLNTDITESIKAAIEKYKNSDDKLLHIEHDGTDFVDKSDPGNPKKVTGDMMKLLKQYGHVNDANGRMSWDFCWSINVVLDARGSSDPEDDALTYKWKFEGPGSHESKVDAMFNSTSPVSKVVINDIGSTRDRLFQFSLVVNDLERDSRNKLVQVNIESDTNATPILCTRSR